MLYNSFPSIAVALAIIFGSGAFVQLAGPPFVQRAYRRWDFPPKFYRVVGLVELLIALFLAIPQTRIWGVTLAAIVTFNAVVALLNHRQYFWSVPGILLMALLVSLVPAAIVAMV